MTFTLIGAFRIGVLAAIPLAMAAPILAQSRARLPIAEGIWVQTDKGCGTTDNAFVYKGNLFGSIAHYRAGPAQSIERVGRIEASTRGFGRVFSSHDGNRAQGQMPYEMPSAYEISQRPNRQAVIRASSYATGEVAWSFTYRQCAPEALPATLRVQAQRLGFLQSAGTSGQGATPARAAAPSSNPQAVTVNLQFSPRAKAALANKTITLRARYIGEPLPARRAQAEAADLVGEDDYIMAGYVERKVPANDGLITLAPANFSRQHAGWVKTLLVSIDSLGHPPSVRCDTFLERPLAAARAQPVTISCR